MDPPTKRRRVEQGAAAPDADAVDDGPHRVCSACATKSSKSDFSKKQWSKGAATSRCKACVERKHDHDVESALVAAETAMQNWDEEMAWRDSGPARHDPGWNIYGINNAPPYVMEERGVCLREDLLRARNDAGVAEGPLAAWETRASLLVDERWRHDFEEHNQ